MFEKKITKSPCWHELVSKLKLFEGVALEVELREVAATFLDDPIVLSLLEAPPSPSPSPLPSLPLLAPLRLREAGTHVLFT